METGGAAFFAWIVGSMGKNKGPRLPVHPAGGCLRLTGDKTPRGFGLAARQACGLKCNCSLALHSPSPNPNPNRKTHS